MSSSITAPSGPTSTGLYLSRPASRNRFFSCVIIPFSGRMGANTPTLFDRESPDADLLDVRTGLFQPRFQGLWRLSQNHNERAVFRFGGQPKGKRIGLPDCFAFLKSFVISSTSKPKSLRPPSYPLLFNCAQTLSNRRSKVHISMVIPSRHSRFAGCVTGETVFDGANRRVFHRGCGDARGCAFEKRRQSGHRNPPPTPWTRAYSSASLDLRWLITWPGRFETAIEWAERAIHRSRVGSPHIFFCGQSHRAWPRRRYDFGCQLRSGCFAGNPC